MERKIIVVIGASGMQGSGVVNALAKEKSFKVRAISRNPQNYSGPADEVVKADMTKVDTLKAAFENVYGVFAVTNFWEGADEIAQGKNVVEAAKQAGVNHFIWSTLPNVEEISQGEFEVPHFTGKAKVDEYIKAAGFEHFTFVQPPFYYQNLTGMLGPQPKDDGTTGWTLPIDPDKKVIHMADVNDLGKVVAGAFLNPTETGNGSYLSLATELNSFDDILETYRKHGLKYSFTKVPGEVFATFFEGANEIVEMLAYFEKYTYMGPGSEGQIDAAKEIAIGDFISLDNWISKSK